MKRTFTQLDADVDKPTRLSTSTSNLSPCALRTSSKRVTWHHPSAVRDGPWASSQPSSTPASRLSSISPAGTPPPRDTVVNRQFAPDASIVLIGFRGSGKSTLALMTSNYLGRRIVEADDYWYAATGCTRADYRKSHTTAEYRHKDMSVCDAMLRNNAKGFVIVCGPGSVEGTGQLLLQEYAKTHPIIRVHRDAHSICNYLHSKNDNEIQRLLDLCRPRYNGTSDIILLC